MRSLRALIALQRSAYTFKKFKILHNLCKFASYIDNASLPNTLFVQRRTKFSIRKRDDPERARNFAIKITPPLSIFASAHNLKQLSVIPEKARDLVFDCAIEHAQKKPLTPVINTKGVLPSNVREVAIICGSFSGDDKRLLALSGELMLHAAEEKDAQALIILASNALRAKKSLLHESSLRSLALVQKIPEAKALYAIHLLRSKKRAEAETIIKTLMTSTLNEDEEANETSRAISFALLELGDLKAATNDIEEALRYYETAAKKDKDAGAYLRLAQLQSNDSPLRLEFYFRSAIAGDTEVPSYISTHFANLFKKSGQVDHRLDALDWKELAEKT